MFLPRRSPLSWIYDSFCQTFEFSDAHVCSSVKVASLLKYSRKTGFILFSTIFCCRSRFFFLFRLHSQLLFGSKGKFENSSFQFSSKIYLNIPNLDWLNRSDPGSILYIT